MEYQDYDRISDTLMFFNNDVVLEFVVNLSTKDKNGNRLFFHSEVDYDSNKYYGVDKGHNIKRRMSFYFAINDRKAFDRSIIIRPEDTMMLSMIIKNQVLPWYFDSRKKIFSFVDGQLKIVGTFQDVIYSKNEYSYLRLTPCVYQFENNLYKEGIRMYVSSDHTYVDMEIDKFMGFCYFIFNTDMYSAACNLVTYAKIPPYHINPFSISGLSGSRYNQIDNPDLFNDSNQNNKIDQYNKEVNDFFSRVNKKESNTKKKK